MNVLNLIFLIYENKRVRSGILKASKLSANKLTHRYLLYKTVELRQNPESVIVSEIPHHRAELLLGALSKNFWARQNSKPSLIFCTSTKTMKFGNNDIHTLTGTVHFIDRTCGKSFLK